MIGQIDRCEIVSLTHPPSHLTFYWSGCPLEQLYTKFVLRIWEISQINFVSYLYVSEIFGAKFRDN